MIPQVMNVAGAYFTLRCDSQGGESHRSLTPHPLRLMPAAQGFASFSRKGRGFTSPRPRRQHHYLGQQLPEQHAARCSRRLDRLFGFIEPGFDAR